MAKETKETKEAKEIKEAIPKTTDLAWTDYVLGLLSDDEKISGNPTTDGLRRIFEIALNCRLISSTSTVVQTPDINNEKRATVTHSVTYCLNPGQPDSEHLNIITVDGSADVYWGNCDKIYRNHPVAVAETRAEGRALRRALKLRKVVAAEEISSHIEDDPNGDNITKISVNQINFIDVLSQRLNINVIKLLQHLDIAHDSIYNIKHQEAVSIIQKLNSLQQDSASIPENIKGYETEWK